MRYHSTVHHRHFVHHQIKPLVKNHANVMIVINLLLTQCFKGTIKCTLVKNPLNTMNVSVSSVTTLLYSIVLYQNIEVLSQHSELVIGLLIQVFILLKVVALSSYLKNLLKLTFYQDCLKHQSIMETSQEIDRYNNSCICLFLIRVLVSNA